MNQWEKPYTYIVRCISGDAQAGEAIQNYFGWERVYRVICNGDADARLTAQYILDSGNVQQDWIEIDPELTEDINEHRSHSSESPDVIVVPSNDWCRRGGIIAVYRHNNEFIYEPRLGAA